MTDAAHVCLFVYGSLTTAAPHPMGERLRAEASLIGPATILGRLYKISWYPAMVASTDPNDVVHGEAYRLHDPEQSLSIGLTNTKVSKLDQADRTRPMNTRANSAS